LQAAKLQLNNVACLSQVLPDDYLGDRPNAFLVLGLGEEGHNKEMAAIVLSKWHWQQGSAMQNTASWSLPTLPRRTIENLNL
jgi:hypothetical protein